MSVTKPESSAVQNAYRIAVYFNVKLYISHNAFRKADYVFGKGIRSHGSDREAET